MKLKKYAGENERMILTGMIVNSVVLGKIVAGLQSEKKPFASKWSNQIFAWCRDFFNKYQRAPRGSIQSLFRGYAAKQPDEDAVALIEKFLSSLSDDYKAQSRETNVDYLVDLASKYFSEVRYGRLKDELEEGLLQKDIDVVVETVAKFKPVSFSTLAVIQVLTDEETWREALEVTDEDVLIQYPGALGEFFGPHLQRDALVAFLAPEKRGKTWWLIDVAWRAVRSKRRTFFFSVGDMSKRQMIQRLGIRAARRPIGPGSVILPRRVDRNPGSEPRVKFKTVHYDRRIRSSEWIAAQRDVHLLTAMHDSTLRLSCTPNGTTRVEDIERELDEAIREGWIPDVVVVDYADILAAETSSKGEDFRHAVNETWKALRRLSQKYHCLVVTATQSDAPSYDARVITKKNFSEDKRKMAHVNGMVGINQTEEEKGKGLYRLNWVLLREGVYYETKCVTVAGCLAIANPAMRSTW